MARFLPARADSRALHFAHRCEASASDVCAAWLHPALVRRWLFATAGRPLAAAHVDAREGGSFVLRDAWLGRALTYRGTFTRLQAPHALAFTLATPDAPGVVTRVDVAVVPGPDGCGLDVIHAGIPAACADALEARWLGALYGLDETLSLLAQARTGGACVSAG